MNIFVVVALSFAVSMNLSRVEGRGVLNSIINKLPFELHLPGYQYCGPGTKLAQRLNRGDQGINSLDRACKTHDISYSNHKDLHSRHAADKILEEAAWKRVKDRNSSTNEKLNAWLVTTGMKAKRKLGMGTIRQRKRRTRQVAFNSNIVKPIKSTMRNVKYTDSNLRDNVKLALDVAKLAVKKAGGKKGVRMPRIIPIPSVLTNGARKTGGFLPFLIPLFAGLSAAGALASGVSNVVKAVKQAKSARDQLGELKRHNETMESLAIGKQNKTGNGLYLKPYRKGMGLFLHPFLLHTAVKRLSRKNR